MAPKVRRIYQKAQRPVAGLFEIIPIEPAETAPGFEGGTRVYRGHRNSSVQGAGQNDIKFLSAAARVAALIRPRPLNPRAPPVLRPARSSLIQRHDKIPNSASTRNEERRWIEGSAGGNCGATLPSERIAGGAGSLGNSRLKELRRRCGRLPCKNAAAKGPR